MSSNGPESDADTFIRGDGAAPGFKPAVSVVAQNVIRPAVCSLSEFL